MRRDFCSFLLIMCPCLRVYGNISYNKPYGVQSASDQGQSSEGAVSQSDRSGRRSTGSGHRSPSSDHHGHGMIKTCLKGTIVCQPKKGQTVIIAPPHISIESPD